MKIDITAIFFNASIPGATATAPWCVSIGQGKDKKINESIPGLRDILSGLIYTCIQDKSAVDLSIGSRNNEYLLISKFDKVFVNGGKLPGVSIIATLVREHTKSHEGRLRISLPPYAKFSLNDVKFSNEESYQAISKHLGCGDIYNGGCWFVDDISVIDQDELHFSCIVVDKDHSKTYNSSQQRSSEWSLLSNDNEFPVTRPLFYDDSNLSLQKIFYGAPGTGKSFTIDDIVDDDNSVRTTFHPDTDYASFVGAYKPTMESVPMSYVSEGKAKYAQPFGEHTGKERKIVYKYVPQAFLKAYSAAWKNYMSGKPYFLVIEEINRGNCAQIFGDLFQLLDRNNSGSSSYPICADEDIHQYLADFFKESPSENHPEYLTDEERDAIRDFVFVKDNGKHVNIGEQILNGLKLLLPPNLHIWATMNTSDQSLFPIDSAFKRRWDWEYMPIVYNPTDKRTGHSIEWKFRVDDSLYSWGVFLKKINPEIYALTESSDKQMGYFFAKADHNTGIISENVFLNKVLFYLWTDVFKDYAIDSKAFQSEDLKRPFRFSDFFEDNANIEKFLKNLGIEPIGVAEQSNEDEDDIMDPDSISEGKDNTKYQIDGEGRYSKCNVAVELVKRFVAQHPEMSAVDVVKQWQQLPSLVHHFIELQKDYDSRTEDGKKRAKAVQCNGENIYVGIHGWAGVHKIHELQDAIAAQGWPWKITPVEDETTD